MGSLKNLSWQELERRERELLERAAEMEEMAQRLLPDVQAADKEWLIARMLQEPLQSRRQLPETLLRLWKSRYHRIPVGIREFIEGKAYLNLPIGLGGVYPKIVEALEELFEHEYCEVVLAGSIGWGKSTYGTIAVAYDLYRLSCLKDPAVTYGMKPNSNMTFVNISVDKTQAKTVFFTDLYNIIKASPYFTHVFPFQKRLENEIRFPRNVRCRPVAASEQAALGVGVFCAFIDEVNYMEVVEGSKRSARGTKNIYDQAEAVYNKLRARMRSRMNLQGRLRGRIYASSSARYPDDFTERLMKQAREERAQGLRNMLALNYALWETIPEGKISKERFRVEVGDYTRNTRILTGDEKDIDESRVIEVPVDYRRDFEHDPDLAVRDMAGRSVLSIKPFISRREKIAKMFELGKSAGLKHPFTKLTVTLQEEDPALERLLPEHLHWIEQQETNELGRPKTLHGKPVMRRVLFPALYHAHVDLSKGNQERGNDAAGLVIAHNIGARKVKRFDFGERKDVEELKPVIRVDLALQIVAPKHGQIDIPRIRAILYQLQRSHGMNFGKVTFDTFGSQESAKTLHDEGFDSDILSVDKDTTPYEMLRTAIYDERIECYYVPVLERELIQLERGPKKIDHPSSHGASKDIADCLAAVVYHCEEGWRRGESARGLFQFGIVEHTGELPPELQKDQDDIIAKIARGEELSISEEDKMLFQSIAPDLYLKKPEDNKKKE